MKGSVKKLFKLFAPERGRCAVMFVLLIASCVFVALGPKALGNVTDAVIAGLGGAGIAWETFFRWAGIVSLIYVLQFFTKWISARLSAQIVTGIAYRLRQRVEAKLWKLPPGYYDANQLGDLMSRTTNDIDNIVTVLESVTNDFPYYVLMLAGMVVMMFLLYWRLSIVTIAVIALSLWMVKRLTKMTQPRFRQQWAYMGAINASVNESINGHGVIKAYGLEEQFTEAFREKNRKLYSATLQATVLSNLIQPLSRVLTNLNYVIVALMGAFQVIRGRMTIGEVQAFIQYARQFQNPFTQVAQQLSQLQSGLASLDRVFELLDSPEELRELPDAAQSRQLTGQIEFEDVFFSYSKDTKLIEHMNLRVKPGQTVAIVGGTGAGKTTLVNLIERFYEIDSGKIVLDGDTELHQISREALRRNIGMVLQDTWLFNGTIEENLRYGIPEGMEVSQEEFMEACRAAFVDNFVRSLSDGYQTVLSNEQSAVSAGEKQLLTIARAFLMKPNILILDEATSSVDTRTEALIQEAINRLRQGRTSFVIAHRLSTIRGADVILVMEHGHIVEQGNHAELLARNGAYAALYRAQFAQAAE